MNAVADVSREPDAQDFEAISDRFLGGANKLPT